MWNLYVNENEVKCGISAQKKKTNHRQKCYENNKVFQRK